MSLFGKSVKFSTLSSQGDGSQADRPVTSQQQQLPAQLGSLPQRYSALEQHLQQQHAPQQSMIQHSILRQQVRQPLVPPQQQQHSSPTQQLADSSQFWRRETSDQTLNELYKEYEYFRVLLVRCRKETPGDDVRIRRSASDFVRVCDKILPREKECYSYCRVLDAKRKVLTDCFSSVSDEDRDLLTDQERAVPMEWE